MQDEEPLRHVQEWLPSKDMMFQCKLLKPSQRVTYAKYWQKSRSDFSLPLWWEPWIVISLINVCEHMLAVHGDSDVPTVSQDCQELGQAQP